VQDSAHQEPEPFPDVQDSAHHDVQDSAHPDVQDSAHQEYPKEERTQVVPKEERTEASLPPLATPDVIRELFTEGLPILIGLTGMTENRCRGMIGRLRKEAGDDCPRVLAALHRATDVRPSDPFPWLLEAVRERPTKLSVLDQIRADWNLGTFLTPVFDDEDPEPASHHPELARIAP
jgi:hypothetical protein